MTAADLPPLNAALNGLATVLLVSGWVCIRTGRRAAHRACMVGALAVSSVFLVSYVTHKALVHGVHTKVGLEGMARTGYYLMLFSHVVLAAGIVPLALLTMVRAFRERFDAHRRIARWTLPIWLYVSVTGVLIYFMLYHWFPAAP